MDSSTSYLLHGKQVDQIPPLPPPMKKGPGRPKKNRRNDGREESASGSKLKRKLGDFTCTACGGKKHNKQTCPILKKQRVEEFQAQQTAPAPNDIGPSQTATAPTDIGPSQTAPTPTAFGPTQTAPAPSAIGSSTFNPNPNQSGPEEIELSMSQPPPIIQSPSKTHTMLLRKKQPLKRGPPQPRQQSPPPTATVQPQDDSSKAYQFMPTPGFKKTFP